MKKFLFVALITATGLSPVVVSAAEVAPTKARASAQTGVTADFQRGEGRGERGSRGEGRGQGRAERQAGNGEGRAERQAARVEGRRSEVRAEGGQQVRIERRQNRAERVEAPPAQTQRVTRQGSDVRVQRREASQDGRYYDRNRDGNLDRRWDRNRDGNLDRSYDRNRDGRLDRRLDRNDDERIDRRYDRNRNGDIDRRYDRNNDNRVDRGYGRNNDNRWSTGWRNDNRYDWRGHRQRYSNYYRPGRYYAPYRSHRYSGISIGFSLGSSFYGSNYWINDPGYYRLPPAYGSYRWVRYYDDVLLVDLRSGQVVDVIRDFFW